MILKDKIFSFYTIVEKIKDCCKNANGKGILERLNEVVGEYWDTELGSKIDNLVENVLSVPTIYSSFLAYLDHRYSNSLTLIDNLEWHKRILSNLLSWYKVRGTIVAYRALFGLIDLNVSIININQDWTFDSNITFDDDSRTFDSGCSVCNKYIIDLTGSIILTPELEKFIFNVVAWNKAVTSDIQVKYNGNYITI